MGKASPSIFVWVAKDLACIKIAGRANFSSSVNFKTVIHELKERGYCIFVLDLTECVTMDSTFLGVLAGLALKLKEPSRQCSNAQLELFNPNPRVLDLLENLGVSHLFAIQHAPNVNPPPPADSPARELSPSREELSQTCLEAHETLMAINPNNIPKFKEVTLFLAEDLKKLREQEQNSEEGGGKKEQ